MSVPGAAVSMTARNRPALGEALRRVDGQVDRGGPAIQDQLCHAQADCRRGLEAGAAETAIEVEAVWSGRTEHRMLVGRDAVIAAVGRVQRAVLHDRDAPADAVDAALHEAGPGMIGVTVG